MIPRILLFSAALLAIGSAAGRPNIVLIIADDVSWNDFGCYGNTGARTPAIDKLAGNGMRFDRFILTASSCSPSRCSIVTGRYPHNNGAASELHRPLSGHLVKFPELLKKAGYHTALAGKDHMPQEKAREKDVWDVKRGTKTPNNSGGEGHWVEVVKSRPVDKPFFFWFAATDAHREWDGDKQWIPGKYGPKHDPARMVVPPYLADTEATRRDLASYHNEITRFDYFIGRVVRELEAQGVLDNTLIMIMADNGRAFPRAKTRVHDSGMKSAFVAHWPEGISKAGSATDSLVSAIDICPTVLELAGVEIPAPVQGFSFAKLFKDPAARHRKHAFSEHNWHDYQALGRSVRDDDGFVYVWNGRPEEAWLGPGDAVTSPSHKELVKLRSTGSLSKAQKDHFLKPRPTEELYFTPEDPRQVDSLTGDPDAAARLEILRAVMKRWKEETGDSAPEHFTPDKYDRITGYFDHETGKRIRATADYGDYAGQDKGADKVNRPGPR